MAMVINSNIASLNAQRNLSSTQSSMSEAMQRLSSGLRINSAKDDAAGLAIATRFTTQINGLNQAVRNANDGISMSQTGEAALGEVTNNLQRIRELAIQSANSTNSASDRAALDSEVQQRLSEITRIASQTSFNGQKLLNGSLGTATFQIGANVGETIDITLAQGMRSDQMGNIASDSGLVTSNALAANDLTIQVGTGDVYAIDATTADNAAAGQTNSSAYAKVQAINSASITGLTATASNSVQVTWSDFADTAASDTYKFSINGQTDLIDLDNTQMAAADIDSIVAQINTAASDTGVTATKDSGGGSFTLTAVDGRDIIISQAIVDAAGTDLDGGMTASLAGGDALAAAANGSATQTTQTNRGTVTLTSAEQITLGGNNETYVGFSDGEVIGVSSTNNLSTSNVATVADSELTIQRVDSALATVSDLRSEFGAIQNRFESTISNLSTIAENLSASRSRIEDADFASETAKMSRAQVLQQAGTSILAQANASTQSVLSLLQ